MLRKPTGGTTKIVSRTKRPTRFQRRTMNQNCKGFNMKFSAAVYGLGNIGRCAVEALETMPDCRCAGVVRRTASLGTTPHLLRGVPEFASLDELAARERPDVVLLCAPSRQVPELASAVLRKGFCTVDSFDIHTRMSEVVSTLDAASKDGKTVAVTAAGWDPGTDSVVRALFEAMTPAGTSFTNFGRGRSMGHSVAARALPGVADATSLTLPLGGGRHSRLVYVVLQPGAKLEDVQAAMKADAYFSHDPLDVRAVSAEEMPFVADDSHGVLLERIGASGTTSNQRLTFDMRIDNPALTAQVMASCARAAVRMHKAGQYGAYTLIDIPPVQLLPGERMANVARLV